MTNRVDTGGGANIQGDAAAGRDLVGRDQHNYFGEAAAKRVDPNDYLDALLAHPRHAPWARRYVPLAGVLTEARTPADWDDIAPELTLLEASEEGAQRQVRRVPLTDIKDAVARHDAWVLLGEPGSGKTTTLQRLLLDLANARLQAGQGPLPLLLALADYRDYVSPHAFVAAVWRERMGADDLDARLRAGGVFLLVDALNEMPFRDAADYRARVAAWGRFARDDWPRNRIVFTCRGRDYSEPLGLPQVEIERLDDARVRAFLGRYLPGALADTAWARLAADPVLDLVRNPFCLLMLCELIGAGGAWPSGRAGLFAGFVGKLLDRERRRNHPDWPAVPDALTGALAALAEGMQRLGEGTRLPRGEVLARLPTRVETTGGPLDLDPAAVVRLGLAATLLDTEADPRTGEPGGLVRFYHHQIQEFFAARALLEAERRGLDLRDRWAAPRFKSEMPDPGRLRDDEPLPPPPTTGWEEPTLLAVGLARDPAALIAAVRGCNPVLAARCLMDPGVPALPEEVERTRAALLADLENPAVHLRARIAAGEALGRLGDPRFAVPAGTGVRVLPPPLVEIPAGAVRLGSSWWEVRRLTCTGFQAGDERPRRRVRLAAFAIGRFPVTNAEYGCFIADGGYADERWWETEQARAWRRGELKSGAVDDALNAWRRFKADPGLMQRQGWSPYHIARWQRLLELDEAKVRAVFDKQNADRPLDSPADWTEERFNNPSQPVVGVNWFEARAYCRWLTERRCAAGDASGPPLPAGALVRLPTEAEWERAARLGSGRRFPWGNRWDPDRANTVEGQALRTTPVGVYPHGASPAGVHDLAGNCWEWCASRYLDYPVQPGDGRDDPESAGYRVVRGGSWYRGSRLARAAYRDRNDPVFFSRILGFRVVLSLADSVF
jgi:formylglycine-generating enzyme required for sulfatase activity